MITKSASRAGFAAGTVKRLFPGLADRRLHYLDSAATAQMPDCVFEALRGFEIEARANVHEGLHRRPRAATEAYNGARAQAARFLNAYSDQEVVFTYGATSAINLLAHSFGTLMVAGDEILLSVLEHHSNLTPWQTLAAQRGIVLRFLPMTPEGRLDLEALESRITDRCRLVALTHCSNVTGAVTDVAPVVAAARSVGAKVMLDGAQHVAHSPVDVRALGVDFYAFSGHKAFGPTGVGILWGRAALLATMPPFMTGGQMVETVTLGSARFRPPPRRFEAGTPPIAAAIGLGAALDWMQGLDWNAIREHEARLTRSLLGGLASIKGVRILGPLDLRLRTGVVSFCMEHVSPEEVCIQLDRKGVALRGGYHCAQPLFEVFRARGAARASVALYNVDVDVDALLEGVQELANSRAG